MITLILHMPLLKEWNAANVKKELPYVLPAEVISMAALVLVTCHYVFPYNQMTILVGYGQKYYEFRDVMQLAVILTVLVTAMLFGLYLPWWRLTGFL